MTRLVWLMSAGAAAVALFFGIEWLAWLSGRRWYVPLPDTATSWTTRERLMWEADHAGA